MFRSTKGRWLNFEVLRVFQQKTFTHLVFWVVQNEVVKNDMSGGCAWSPRKEHSPSESDMCRGQIPSSSSDLLWESKDHGKRRVSAAPHVHLIGSDAISHVNMQVK